MQQVSGCAKLIHDEGVPVLQRVGRPFATVTACTEALYQCLSIATMISKDVLDL